MKTTSQSVTVRSQFWKRSVLSDCCIFSSRRLSAEMQKARFKAMLRSRLQLLISRQHSLQCSVGQVGAMGLGQFLLRPLAASCLSGRGSPG